MRILFDSKDRRFKEPFGTLKPSEACQMTVLIPSQIYPVAMDLIVLGEDGTPHASFSASFAGKEDAYDRFKVTFALQDPGLYFYFFRITTQNESFALYRQGWDQTNMEAGETWQLSVIPDSFVTPETLSGSVMYQIFPDRFAGKGVCNTSGKLKPFWIHDNVEDTPAWEPDQSGEVTNSDFFGGNLAGITEKLDYLAALGVKVVYLNPIFKAWSNHRYDTADYLKIDELLGTENDFRALCRKAHALGMKIILDGVFSHTGSRSVYFDETGEFGHGAVSDPASPYRDWFQFKRFPDDYTAWWGVKTLPCVDEMQPSYRHFIIGGEDSVIAHWLKAGADGFRLDVADELPDAFMKELRDRLKEINPDALLIGEVWEDASNKISYGVRRKYFSGGELDSVMNYPFKDAILSYASGSDNGLALRGTVMTIVENYPQKVHGLLMNMLSTHDTCRILTLLSPSPAPEQKSERAVFRMKEQDRVVAEERLRLAFFLQFVLPGMPCIFYGDEIGTEGFEDPFCRSYFRWDRVKGNPLFSFVSKLSAIRNGEEALKRGETEVASDGQGSITVTRSLENETLIAVVNNDQAKNVANLGSVLISGKSHEGKGGYLLEQNGFILFRVKGK